MKIVPVILSGGSGARLWPVSRKEYPKQYLPLAKGGLTMLQATIRRLSGLENLNDPIVICNAEHRFLVAQQLREIGVKNPIILLESSGKNTAIAIAVAAFFAANNLSIVDDYQLLVLSADHDIQGVEIFHQAVRVATHFALDKRLVAFGVKPQMPHTGYGYIEVDLNVNDNGSESAIGYEIRNFVEKPDEETAQKYLNNGNYFWNSGMFMFELGSILEEFFLYVPEIADSAKRSVEGAHHDYDFIRLAPYSPNLQSISIDYAIMEKTQRGVVVPFFAQWSDLGSWNALWEQGEKDQDGNCIHGDAIALDTKNSYIYADHHIVVTIGVDDLVVVDTPDATLVSAKSHSQKVKFIVERLERDRHHLAATHRKVFRPWGWYDVIDEEKSFKVKRILVNSGGSLSLQSHKYRSEHWIVVSGIATITRDDQLFSINENMSIYIPVGMKHRLQNNEDIPLELVEVQVGDYLEEDDIERFDDQYER